jgi:hypothetical protein
LEPESERQVRMAGETTKADSETSFNYLKMVADKDKEINQSIEFGRERDDTLHQSAEIWRVEMKIAKQLGETSNLKEVC